MKKLNAFQAVWKVLGMIIKYGAILAIFVETVQFFMSKVEASQEGKKLLSEPQTSSNES